MYKWISTSANPCPSCAALDGQVHSLETWKQAQLEPKDHKLYCQSHCTCTMHETEEAESGDLSAVPLRQEGEAQAMPKSLPLMFSLALDAQLAPVSNRAEMLRQIESGELESIIFDAAVYSSDKPNKNGYLFEGDMDAFAASFADQPFVKDHRESLDALFGSIEQSNHSSNRFVQQIKLTTREAMTAYVEGKLRRFSIAWFWEQINCSLCHNELFSRDCDHWPGQKTKEGVCQPIFINPTGRHTAAVSVPASPGTEVLAALSAHKSEIFGGPADDQNSKGMKGENSMPKETPTPQAGQNPAEELTAQVEANRQAAAVIMDEQARLNALEEQARESDALLVSQCEHLLTSGLAASRLPEVTQARIEKQFKGRKFQPAELKAAINEAREEVAALTAGRTVAGPGRAGQMFNSDDAIRAAAFDMFGAERDPGTESLKVAKLSGIRELYLMLTGDQGFTGNVDEDLIMAGLATTTNFPGIVKDSMNKMLVKAWAKYGEAGYGWWKEIVTEDHFTNLNTVDWVITGTIGSLPTVSERGEYTVLPIGDNVETSDWTKYGGYVPLTLEAILRDNLQAFKVFPGELALAGMRNISEQVAAIFTANSGVGPTLADSGALFNATAVTTAGGHKNLLTTALGTDYTAWEAVAKAMYDQPMHVANTYDGESKLGTGKKQAIDPKYCLVPRALRGAAQALFTPRWASLVESIPSVGGPSYAGEVTPLVVPEWTDATDWAAVADPALLPSVMIGEIFGLIPQIYNAGRENDPAMFMNDESRLKVRQFLAVGVSNYRGLHKSNVAG